MDSDWRQACSSRCLQSPRICYHFQLILFLPSRLALTPFEEQHHESNQMDSAIRRRSAPERIPDFCRSPQGPYRVLGAVRKVVYSKAGDPGGAAAGEDSLKIRALLADGVVKEWTTGDAHDVTDRSFVVRRVMRLNDALPGDAAEPSGKSGEKSAPAASRWVWQRGPWLLVDRVTGHIVALRPPDYEPGVSQVSWFRDYGAYCGVTASGKSLYAVVAQVAARKAVLAKKLEGFDAENHPDAVCGAAEWQREPLRITFHPVGKDAVSFDLVPGSAVLVEDAGDEAETAVPEAKPK
jgi:hypothetical protein